MTESPGYQSRELERQVAGLVAKNARMSDALIAARDQIIDLKSQLDDLAKPPGTYAIFLAAHPDGTVDIMSAGRKMHVGASRALDLSRVRPGQEVMLNEALTVVGVGGYAPVGELVTVKEILGTDRALVVGRADDERVVRLAGQLLEHSVCIGDALTIDPRSGFVFERIPRSE